jgi:hypothetical protein
MEKCLIFETELQANEANDLITTNMGLDEPWGIPKSRVNGSWWLYMPEDPLALSGVSYLWTEIYDLSWEPDYILGA